MSQDLTSYMPDMRAKIVATARSWIGTPYHHQGRLKGTGCDCAGLIIGVRKELELSDFDIDGYSRFADGVSILDICQQQLFPTNNPSLGDVLVFRIRKFPQHLGFLSCLNGYPSLIHSYQHLGMVKEHILGDWWNDRVVASFSMINYV